MIKNNNRLGSWLTKPDGEETNSNDNQNEHVEEIELTAEEMEERQKRAQEIMNRNKKEYSKEEIEELDDRLADLEVKPTGDPAWGRH